MHANEVMRDGEMDRNDASQLDVVCEKVLCKKNWLQEEDLAFLDPDYNELSSDTSLLFMSKVVRNSYISPNYKTSDLFLNRGVIEG